MEQKLGNPEEEEYESANEKEGEEITGFSFILAKLAEDKEPLKNSNVFAGKMEDESLTKLLALQAD